MTNALSDKTHVLVTSVGKFWVNDDQKAQLDQAIANDVKFVRLEGSIIMLNSVRGLITGRQLQDLDREKQGEWKCKYGHWHIRGNQCAHGQLR